MEVMGQNKPRSFSSQSQIPLGFGLFPTKSLPIINMIVLKKDLVIDKD